MVTNVQRQVLARNPLEVLEDNMLFNVGDGVWKKVQKRSQEDVRHNFGYRNNHQEHFGHVEHFSNISPKLCSN